MFILFDIFMVEITMSLLLFTVYLLGDIVFYYYFKNSHSFKLILSKSNSLKSFKEFII